MSNLRKIFGVLHGVQGLKAKEWPVLGGEEEWEGRTALYHQQILCLKKYKKSKWLNHVTCFLREQSFFLNFECFVPLLQLDF